MDADWKKNKVPSTGFRARWASAGAAWGILVAVALLIQGLPAALINPVDPDSPFSIAAICSAAGKAAPAKAGTPHCPLCQNSSAPPQALPPDGIVVRREAVPLRFAFTPAVSAGKAECTASFRSRAPPQV